MNRSAATCCRINLVHGEPGGGLSKRPGWIKLGGNSGFQAVGLALLFGAARVVLLGYDMQFNGERKHWHPDHPADLGNPLPEKFREWRQSFDQLATATTVPIVNASRDTALRCFPRMDLDACLAEPAAFGAGAPRRVRKRA